MKKICLLFILCCLLFPISQAYALSAPITSPYGWRTHPVFGTQRYHSGVDLGVDEGTPITAVQPGTVEVAEWLGGYGYAVMIDHGNGLESLYGHCSQLMVYAGQPVSKGQLIALSGNTGWSTGPHLHFEVRVDGSPVDPMPLLLQSGWDISGQYSPSDYYVNSDYDEMLWNFGDFNDVAKLLRDAISVFSGHWSTGLSYLQGDLAYDLVLFMTIDLALTFILFAIKNNEYELMYFMAKKIVQYGIVAALLLNWKTFINDFVLSFMTSEAIIVGGGGDYIVQNASDPSLIVQKGVSLIQPVFAWLSTYSGAHMVANVHTVFLAMGQGLGILLAFAVIGIALLITYLEFYMACLLSVTTIPTGVLRHMQFMAEGGISSVVNAGLKLMITTFMVALVVKFIQDLTPAAYDPIVYMRILVISIGLAIIIGLVPRRINQYLSGTFKFPEL